MNSKNITVESIEEIDKNRQEQREHENSKDGKFGNTYDEKNYLNTKLDIKNREYSKEIKIRLLPIDSESTSPFKRVHMHYVPVNKKINKSGFRNFICLKKTNDENIEQYGKKCPYCEIASQAWENYKNETEETKKEKWKEIAKENMPDEYVIVRCIERGHEDEGPKFWRFRLRSDGKDAMNSIIDLYKTRRIESIEDEYGTDFLQKSKEEQEAVFEHDNFVPLNILDIYDGKDLKITINAVFNKQNEVTNKTSITITDYGKQKPLSQDEEQINAWINDSKCWWNVFPVKPYEYLNIASEGKVPFFSKELNKWIEYNEEDNSSKDTQSESEANIEEIKSTASTVKQMDNNEGNEELPF